MKFLLIHECHLSEALREQACVSRGEFLSYLWKLGVELLHQVLSTSLWY